MKLSFTHLASQFRAFKNALLPPQEMVTLKWNRKEGLVHMRASRVKGYSRKAPLYELVTITTVKKSVSQDINPRHALSRDTKTVVVEQPETFEREGQSSFSLYETFDILSTFDCEQVERGVPDNEKMRATPNHYIHYMP